MMTKVQAIAYFREHYSPHIPKGDHIWRREAWLCFIDSMVIDGSITERQASTWSYPF